MVGTFITPGKDKKYIKHFIGKPNGRDHMDDLGIGRHIILNGS
jgi:hypothetical protein